MPLTAGTRLGPYEVVSPLGAGGMGEVYRARDLKLDRDVAIKVLPDSFAQDADRLVRFTREAKTLAALNHPNIASIYGIEGNALVMELVGGDDLSTLIARGPIPLADALPIARQIADALEAAHEQGIIHRDLKPANIKVRADGTVKVLDFGLARTIDGSSTTDMANSPTLTARGTQMGMIIGTAAYMSPEQARGKAVDRRADIWAFGVVLFEMLTGKRAFAGDDITDVLASVLKSDPDWSAAPANLPAPIRRLLRRCLEKEPKARLSSIGDARLELNELEPAVAVAMPVSPPTHPSVLSRIWPVAAAVVLTALAAAVLRPSAAPLAVGETRTSILAPPGTTIYPDSATVAISPDGKQMAFIVGDINGDTGMWVRQVGSLMSRRLEGTESANLPFWSPDGQRIGFFTSGKLRTVAAAGGIIQTVSDSPGSGGRGATWNASNVIVFARSASGPLFKVSANGGEPTAVTTLGAKQMSHRFPTFLPDGDHFLYVALPGRNGKFDVFVGSLSDSATKMIGQMQASPEYVSPGYLLFPRQNVLAAQAFDTTSLTLSGEMFSLPDQPTMVLDPATSFTGAKFVSAAASGTFAYFSAPVVTTSAKWFNASGTEGGIVKLPEGDYSGVKISPDGTRAVVVRSTSTTESALWLVDLEHGGAVPLTAGAGRNDAPVWSLDGKRIVFASDRDGAQDFYVKNVSDGLPEQLFYRSPAMFKNPEGFSTDGKFLFFQSLDSESAQNIHLLPTTGPQTPQVYIKGPQRDFLSSQSPDGRHVAYTSDETGRFEIYVDSYPTAGDKRQVSTDGGLSPAWSRDGRRLMFISADATWRADVLPGAEFKLSRPTRVGSFPTSATGGAFDPVSGRVLALVPDQAPAGAITLVQNWLKK